MTSDSAFMANKKQKIPCNPSGEGATSQTEASARQSGPHSAPALPQRPCRSKSAPARGRKASNSAPQLGYVRYAKNPKVGIPRQPLGATQRYNRRVPRACESCRQRKTKCSGDTPNCRQCRELRATCHYPEGWREKNKK